MLFEQHQQRGDLRISLQVVHEFAANLLGRKFGLAPKTVIELVADLVELGIVTPRAGDTLAGLQLMGQFQVSFWDALILAAAKREGCALIYSEDFQHNRLYGSVRVVHPFLATSE